MELTALKLPSGDSYLLQDGGKNFLFDVGHQDVVKILHRKGIEHIHVAICSHNDADHTSGFLELLISCIKIDEIWIPNIWLSIIEFLNEHHTELEENLPKIKNWDKTKEDWADILSDQPSNWEDISSARIVYKPNYEKLPYKTCNIVKIYKLARCLGIKIRFFKPIDFETNYSAGYGFFAKNSEEVFKVFKIKTWSEFIQAIKLSAENKYSLVFEYRQEEIPRVLFTADSDLSFMGGNKLDYQNNPMVVTAPHHGSDSNKKAYTIVLGSDITYVKTHNNYVNGVAKRTGKPNWGAFAALKCPKYCTKCYPYNSANKQTHEVNLDFDNKKNRWNAHSVPCKCK